MFFKKSKWDSYSIVEKYYFLNNENKSIIFEILLIYMKHVEVIFKESRFNGLYKDTIAIIEKTIALNGTFDIQNSEYQKIQSKVYQRYVRTKIDATDFNIIYTLYNFLNFHKFAGAALDFFEFGINVFCEKNDHNFLDSFYWPILFKKELIKTLTQRDNDANLIMQIEKINHSHNFFKYAEAIFELPDFDAETFVFVLKDYLKNEYK
jgi:hypothetical protein